jgi:hypothetical protein
MNSHDPVNLLFGGMEKLGPGDNVHTLHVLHLLLNGAERPYPPEPGAHKPSACAVTISRCSGYPTARSG